MRDADGDELVAFYSGTGPDARGRLLTDVWSLSLDELEHSHDYIQWLFPLPERSRAQPDSPVLSPRAVQVISGSREMHGRLLLSADKMGAFYGFELTRSLDAFTVRLADTFPARKRVWMSPGNHNYLRHTRIMKSLVILGVAPLARAWFGCLDDLYRANESVIGAQTHRYWLDAIRA